VEGPAVALFWIWAPAESEPWLGEMLPPAMALPEPDTSMADSPAPGIAPLAALLAATLASGLLELVPSMPEASPPEVNEAVPPPSVDRLPVETEFPPSTVVPLVSVEVVATDALFEADRSFPFPVTLTSEPALESALRETPGDDWEAAAAVSAAPAAAALPVEVAWEVVPVLASTVPAMDPFAFAFAVSPALACPSPDEAAAVSAASAAAAELPVPVELAELRAPALLTPEPPPVLLADESALSPVLTAPLAA